MYAHALHRFQLLSWLSFTFAFSSARQLLYSCIAHVRVESLDKRPIPSYQFRPSSLMQATMHILSLVIFKTRYNDHLHPY